MSPTIGDELRTTGTELWARPVGRGVVSVVAVLAVVYLFELGGDGLRTQLTSNLDRIMLPVMVALLLVNTRGATRTEERRFWGFLIIALASWFAGTMVFFFEQEAGLPRWVDLVVDVFYILLYLGMVLAADQQPQLRSGWSERDPVYLFAMVAASIFIVAIFGYFVVVPWAVQPSETARYFSSFNLYVTLDLLLTLRFVLLYRAASDTRWRRCFGLLAMGTAAMAVGDLLEGLYFAEIFIAVIGDRLDVVWLVPYLCLTAVALTCTGQRDTDAETDAGRQVGSLVPVYAFALPLIHLGLHLLGYLDPDARSAREAIVLVGLVFFAVLIILQQASLEQAVASLRSDLTVRALDEKLRRSQRLEAIGQLAGGIAHDFNNLLMVIRSSSELAVRRLGTSMPQVRDKLAEIDGAADRATDLIRQLLAFGRRQELHPQPVRVDAMVLDLQSMLARLIGDNVRLRVAVGPEPVWAMVDPALLEQVIVNLVVNARDAMPRGGDVAITARAVATAADGGSSGGGGGWAELSVSDSGTGIPAEIRSRIFEPYFTTKEAGQGTGLGLATVYGIVEQSGGVIEVDSAVGGGTTFTVRLPRVDAPRGSRAAAVPASVSEITCRTVLITEDEPKIREALAEYLESIGLEVLQAQDGVDALEVATAFPGTIDLLITDLVMPRMSGPDLAKRMLDDNRDLKVIFMSGYTPETMDEYGIDDRNGEFLQKPFLLADLGRMARRVLEG